MFAFETYFFLSLSAPGIERTSAWQVAQQPACAAIGTLGPTSMTAALTVCFGSFSSRGASAAASAGALKVRRM